MRRFCLMYLAWYELQAILWFKIENVEAIVGGEPAVIDQFKYMVSLQADGKHVCGGAIVSNVHVITAAHCVIGEDNKFINKKYTVLGRIINLMSNEVPPIEEVVQAIFASTDYASHPGKKRWPENYLFGISINFYPEAGDIAILKLQRKLPLNNYLSALNIPSRGGTQNLPKFTNLTATVTGYGTNIDPYRGVKRNRNSTVTTSNESNRLNFIQTTVQHKNECKNKVEYFIHEKYIVAKVQKRSFEDRAGACTGDDGSPLVYNGILIGVLAQYWPACDESLFGSVYTRTSYYLQFIKEVIKGIHTSKSRFAMYKESRSASGQTFWNLVESR